MVSPVNRVRVGLDQTESVHSLGSVYFLVSEHLLVLKFAEVSKSVDSKSVARALAVLGVHVIEVLLKDGKSVGVFLFGAISSSVFTNEVDESSFSFSDWG